MYILKTIVSFSAAHSLRGYIGDCARIHGHNWKIEAEVHTPELNDIGIGIDFKDVKNSMRQIIEPLDHQYLNELAPFDKLNPTAENIAKWFFDKLAPQINHGKIELAAITLWETDKSSIRYEPN